MKTSPNKKSSKKYLSNQAIFDKVATHLAQQGRKSENARGVCLYRGPEGTRCAAGCLLKDEFYHSRYEDQAVTHPMVLAAFKMSGIAEASIGFLRGLQSIHDKEEVTNWKRALRCFGEVFSIRTDILDTLTFPTE